MSKVIITSAIGPSSYERWSVNFALNVSDDEKNYQKKAIAIPSDGNDFQIVNNLSALRKK